MHALCPSAAIKYSAACEIAHCFRQGLPGDVSCGRHAHRQEDRLGRHQSREPGTAVSNETFLSGGNTNLDKCNPVTLHGCHTSSAIKLDLPDAGEIGQQVLDAFASLDIPHL